MKTLKAFVRFNRWLSPGPKFPDAGVCWCATCGYEIAGGIQAEPHTCSECGAQIDPLARSTIRLPRRPRAFSRFLMRASGLPLVAVYALIVGTYLWAVSTLCEQIFLLVLCSVLFMAIILLYMLRWGLAIGAALYYRAVRGTWRQPGWLLLPLSILIFFLGGLLVSPYGVRCWFYSNDLNWTIAASRLPEGAASPDLETISARLQQGRLAGLTFDSAESAAQWVADVRSTSATRFGTPLYSAEDLDAIAKSGGFVLVQSRIGFPYMDFGLAYLPNTGPLGESEGGVRKAFQDWYVLMRARPPR